MIERASEMQATEQPMLPLIRLRVDYTGLCLFLKQT